MAVRRQIVGRHQAQQQSGRRCRIAEIKNIVRRRQPADPDTVDEPALSRLLNTGTSARSSTAGTQDILRFQQPRNGSPANRNSADHQRPVRNGFIAGDVGSSYQRVAGTGLRAWSARFPDYGCGGGATTASVPYCAADASRVNAFGLFCF